MLSFALFLCNGNEIDTTRKMVMVMMMIWPLKFCPSYRLIHRKRILKNEWFFFFFSLRKQQPETRNGEKNRKLNYVENVCFFLLFLNKVFLFSLFFWWQNVPKTKFFLSPFFYPMKNQITLHKAIEKFIGFKKMKWNFEKF